MMSINFENPMNEESRKFIEEAFKDIPAMDDRTVLTQNQMIEQKQMKELANIAGQPVSVEIHGEGDVKEMSDGTRYKVTPAGWVKLPNKSQQEGEL